MTICSPIREWSHMSQVYFTIGYHIDEKIQVIFQPDFPWIKKQRMRGANATKYVFLSENDHKDFTQNIFLSILLHRFSSRQYCQISFINLTDFPSTKKYKTKKRKRWSVFFLSDKWSHNISQRVSFNIETKDKRNI